MRCRLFLARRYSLNSGSGCASSNREKAPWRVTTRRLISKRLNPSQTPMTYVHSLYALMGGFAFDTSTANPYFLPNGRSRLTLRLEALKYIAERAPSLIPDLPADAIRDKSKANGLAKSLVCLQAMWFCLQCITRVAQGQAISFLELHTFRHAVCTLLLYGLWWHKPLDIDSPSLLMGEEAWEICALMCLTRNGESSRSTTVSSLMFPSIFSDEPKNQ